MTAVRNRQNERMRGAKAKAFVDLYKMNRGCFRCGYAEHPVALHCNHLDRSDKNKSIAYLTKKGVIENIKRELEKCEVLCANCHAIFSFANNHHYNLGGNDDLS